MLCRRKEKESYPVPAVVVSIDINGLAICRSLGRRGVPVYAVWSDRRTPARWTKYAESIQVRDVTGPELYDDLVKIRSKFTTRPVLLLTADHMLITVAEHYDHLKELYKFDIPSPELIKLLTHKNNLEKISMEKGLAYPATHYVSSMDELDRIIKKINYPAIIKPMAPPSIFNASDVLKVLKIYSEDQLKNELKRIINKVPQFLIQEWIEGDEKSLFFAQYYYNENHNPTAGFVGRKVRCRPRITGNSCCVELIDNPSVWKDGVKFFSGFELTGPVSIEFKQGRNEKYYVIEPTVGRFDFWNGLGPANGYDIPYLSYAMNAGCETGKYKIRSKPTVYVDFARDFRMFIERLLDNRDRKETFEYFLKKTTYGVWAKDDPFPTIITFPWWMWVSFKAGLNKFFRILFRR